MIRRLLLLVAILSLLAALTLALRASLKVTPDRPANPLKFSHTFHVKEQGIGCTDCHASAGESVRSSDNLRPTHDNCMTCHEEQVNTDCAYCHTSPEDIPPSVAPDRETIFSHQLHASQQNIDCQSCHAGLDDAVTAGKANMPSMATCVTCHEEQRVATVCETCHTDFVSLKPKNHLAGDFKLGHKKISRFGMKDASCATCHAESFCQDCHMGGETESFGRGREKNGEPLVRTSTSDSPKQLKLQQVHSLDYRNTHPIDAKAKTIDCTSCHETKSFCVDCHQSGENAGMAKMKPEWHSMAGFTTMGKGSGGGRHAELARRDLESCTSCHDVEGADPTCMVCHTEGGNVW